MTLGKLSIRKIVDKLWLVLLSPTEHKQSAIKGVNNGKARKMQFPIKDFFSKYDKIYSFLWIWKHLLRKSLMEN